MARTKQTTRLAMPDPRGARAVAKRAVRVAKDPFSSNRDDSADLKEMKKSMRHLQALQRQMMEQSLAMMYGGTVAPATRGPEHPAER